MRARRISIDHTTNLWSSSSRMSPDYMFLCAYCDLALPLNKGLYLSMAEGGMICEDCFDLEQKEW